MCISRKSAASSSSDGWQPRTSARTCKSARQRSSIDIQFLRSANKSLSHVHVHLLLLLLLSAFSWPGSSDPAPYSCHPHPPTPVTLSPVPPPYTPYSCHPIHYTGQRTPVILYPIQCSTSYTVDPKPQALDPTPLALDPTPLTLQSIQVQYPRLRV